MAPGNFSTAPLKWMKNLYASPQPAAPLLMATIAKNKRFKT
jgi:hypothetical protein